MNLMRLFKMDGDKMNNQLMYIELTPATVEYEGFNMNLTSGIKNGDGDWIDDSARDTEMAWEDIAYSIKSEGTTELQVSWKDIYGDRTSGHYRIVKKVNDFRGTGDFDTYEVCAEFDIK